jgi:hypothetical protein
MAKLGIVSSLKVEIGTQMNTDFHGFVSFYLCVSMKACGELLKEVEPAEPSVSYFN